MLASCVMDIGILMGQGRTVSFANTVIIMTSNLGSHLLLEHGSTPAAKEMVLEVVKKHFRPEFLNRLDDLVVFDPLSTNMLRQVARLQVRSLFRPPSQYLICGAVRCLSVLPPTP